MSEPDTETRELSWLRGYIAGRTGVQINNEHRDFLAFRLQPVLQKYQLSDIPALTEHIRKHPMEVLSAVIDVVTTHETSFFRDPDMFQWLEQECLPPLLIAAKGREFAVWSAACSTGQEALSVGMLLLERWPKLPFRIVGTDISPGTVERACTGKFSLLEINRGLPARRLVRWFVRSEVHYVTVPELLSRCQFITHNLLERTGSLGLFDLVLLQNVLIYFSNADRDIVFRNLAAVMRPGAVLVVGAAENLSTPPSGLFTRHRSAKATWLIRTQEPT